MAFLCSMRVHLLTSLYTILEMASTTEEATGPDTQLVGQLLWEELHENGTQQPACFEWTSIPASPAAAQQPLAAAPSRISTPEIVAGFCIPPDLVSWRQRLFECNVGETVRLSSEQWQLYWPFVTNIWTRHTSPYTPKRKTTVRTHWDCRFFKERADVSLGSGKRGKKTRRAIGCPAKLTEIHDTSSDVRQYAMDGRHNHSLTDLDMTKINEAIQSWVKIQLQQGFSAMAIERVAKGKGKDTTSAQNLLDAGGCRLDVKYIINTAQRLNLQKHTPRHVAGKVPAENQAREALEWLGERQEEWYSAYLETMYQGSKSPALVFARKRTIKTLRERGLLTLMDSTHNTNRQKWYVYPLFQMTSIQ
jgi:hypothetical protein